MPPSAPLPPLPRQAPPAAASSRPKGPAPPPGPDPAHPGLLPPSAGTPPCGGAAASAGPPAAPAAVGAGPADGAPSGPHGSPSSAVSTVRNVSGAEVPSSSLLAAGQDAASVISRKGPYSSVNRGCSWQVTLVAASPSWRWIWHRPSPSRKGQLPPSSAKQRSPSSSRTRAARRRSPRGPGSRS